MKMNIQHLTSNVERRTLTRLGSIGCWVFPLVIFPALPLRSQTNALPALLPPYGELPPTFWEQRGTSITFAGLGLIALVVFAVWLIFRVKPNPVIPPEVQARQALEMLRQQLENGAVLSRVSQVVRNYFIAAFQLTPGEYTTVEFNRALSGHEQIGGQLSRVVVDFLRDCDTWKFSTTMDLATTDAVNRALQLIAQAEQRRTQLRQLTEIKGRHA